MDLLDSWRFASKLSTSDPVPEHSNTLSTVIKTLVIQNGPIPFRRFMEMALYDPQHGYYGSGRARIGRQGDFFTNVSVGPLFAKLIVRQVVEMWQKVGAPTEFTFVEQGAHHGHFTRDFLQSLKVIERPCFDAVKVVLVEPSQAQLACQQHTLADLAHKVQWSPDLAAVGPITGVHFSNELLDAFPVHLVTWTGTQWVERYVGIQENEFVFQDGPITDPRVLERLASLPSNFPPGYTTEINLGALEWSDQLAGIMQTGYVLAVDYGYPRSIYYDVHRLSGTLSAYKAHQRVSNPLSSPGEIDLTAHVDFSSLADQALRGGFALAGFTDQHHFVIALGRLHFTDQTTLTPEYEAELRAFKTLMHPALMGSSFKVFCLAKNAPAELTGFGFSSPPHLALGLV